MLLTVPGRRRAAAACGVEAPLPLHSAVLGATVRHHRTASDARAIPPFATVGLKLGFYYTRLLLAILLHAALRLSEPAAAPAPPSLRLSTRQEAAQLKFV